MARRALLQQLCEVQRAIPIMIGMGFEDDALDFPQQLVGHAVRRAQILDELLRQVLHTRITHRSIGVGAVECVWR